MAARLFLETSGDQLAVLFAIWRPCDRHQVGPDLRVDRLAVAALTEPIDAMLAAHAGGTDAAKWKVFLSDVEDDVIYRDAT